MEKLSTLSITRLFLFSAFFCFLFTFTLQSQTFNYNDSWGSSGFTLEAANPSGVQINFSITQFEMQETEINDMMMKTLHLPGIFLPNDEGKPDLPGTARYIAIPQGADATVEIISSRIERFANIDIAPAPKIPLDTDNGPLSYTKDQLGITPFQYNPITKELIVYRDLKVQVSFIGGNGHFGEDRLRSRWWDPMLESILLNYSSLPQVEYKYQSDSMTEDFEYLIITPNNPDYLSWADTIKNWRTTQGIRTGIVTLITQHL